MMIKFESAEKSISLRLKAANDNSPYFLQMALILFQLLIWTGGNLYEFLEKTQICTKRFRNTA
jgi:hypothetical protein